MPSIKFVIYLIIRKLSVYSDLLNNLKTPYYTNIQTIKKYKTVFIIENVTPKIVNFQYCMVFLILILSGSLFRLLIFSLGGYFEVYRN